MGVKIKANDDRVKALGVAVLLIVRDHLIAGRTQGLITAALVEFRNDPCDFKTRHPKRDLATAKDTTGLKDGRIRKDYLRLVESVETILARLERNGTQFSSLLELDNFFAFNLRQFD